jgi:hypothetical protein
VTGNELALLRYYEAVDSGDVEAALALASPTIAFAIVVPTGVVRGQDTAGLAGYLNGRGDVDRRHVPLRTSTDGDLEFVYGRIVEDGTRTTGHFVAAARVGADGLLAAYQVAFDPELALLGDAR